MSYFQVKRELQIFLKVLSSESQCSLASPKILVGEKFYIFSWKTLIYKDLIEILTDLTNTYLVMTY